MRKQYSLKKHRGFSLIEVLVSAVIMSVGVLGVAGMQVSSLQQNRTALLRSEAQLLGNDMIDRMVVNTGDLVDYAGVEYTDEPSLINNCYTTICSETQMRNFDVAQWQCSINSVDADGDVFPACETLGISGSLPGGQGSIEGPSNYAECDLSSADEGEYCVAVRWLNTDGTTYSKVVLQTRVK